MNQCIVCGSTHDLTMETFDMCLCDTCQNGLELYTDLFKTMEEYSL